MPVNTLRSDDCDKPNLLVLASTYPRWAGDPEPGFVHELAKRMTGHFRVLALVPHAPGAALQEDMDDVQVIRYRYAPARWETLVNDGGIVSNLQKAKWKYLLLPGFVLAQAWTAWRLVRTRRIGVIHAHWLIPQGLVAALLQWLPGIKLPFVVTSHGADLYALRSKPMQALKRFVAGRAARVTVVSGAMRRELERLGVAPDRTMVRPMGVDLAARFLPDANAPRSRDEILFVGRLVEKKGLRHLIEAMPGVLQVRPSAFLTVAGFGPEEPVLRGQVLRLGLEEKVRFAGAVPQDRLPQLYRGAALFVAPFVRAASGDEEGLGLVLVEAIGCGCPVIVGNVPAMVEVLGDGFDDMTVDPANTSAFADRIVAALAESDAARSRTAELREAIGTRFDWTHAAARYRGILAEAIHESTAGRATGGVNG